jgi:predicted signal transduction protein with EAL and GGDEF domain
VETIEQLRLVRELGCDLAQGYLISHPLDPAELGKWKKEFRRRWPRLIDDGRLELWRDVELDPLREGQV